MCPGDDELQQFQSVRWQTHFNSWEPSKAALKDTQVLQDSLDAHVAAPTRRFNLPVMIAVLSLLLCLLIGNTLDAKAHRRNSEAWYIHTLDVLLVAGKLETAINKAIRGERGYLITGDPTFLKPFHQGRGESQQLVRELRALTRDNAAQQQTIKGLDARLSSYLDTMGHLVELERAGRRSEAVALVRAGTGRRQIEALVTAIGRIEAEERQLLTVRQAREQSAERVETFYSYVLASAAAGLLVLLAFAVRSSNRAHARAVELARALRQLATTDALTGLSNRRQFMSELDAEIRRAHRSGTAFTLALLDIDHFKQVNDTHGHPAGDEVLRVAADVLRSVVRDTDMVARIGGEEFAVLMPETGLDQARFAGERLRAEFARQEIVLPNGAGSGVTVSTGLAEFSGESADQVMSRADQALYKAKREGRNTVRVAA